MVLGTSLTDLSRPSPGLSHLFSINLPKLVGLVSRHFRHTTFLGFARPGPFFFPQALLGGFSKLHLRAKGKEKVGTLCPAGDLGEWGAGVCLGAVPGQAFELKMV